MPEFDLGERWYVPTEADKEPRSEVEGERHLKIADRQLRHQCIPERVFVPCHVDAFFFVGASNPALDSVCV
jgi:hypothetical protein